MTLDSTTSVWSSRLLLVGSAWASGLIVLAVSLTPWGRIFPRVRARYQAFDLWLETADVSLYIRLCDLISQIAFVAVACILAGLLLCGAVVALLH